MARRSSRFLFLLGLAAFVTLGMPEGALGTAWPFMRSDLARPLSDLGAVVSTLTIGFVLASSTVARVVRRFGLGTTLVLAIGLRLIAFVGLATTDVWSVLLGSSFILGFGGGWQDSGFNIDFALNRGVRAMNLLHAMFGVGATIGPLVVVAFVPEWRPAFWLLAAAQAVILLIVMSSASSWEIAPPDDSGSGRIRISIIAVFFLYTGLEVAGGQWAFSLLFEGRGIAEATAGRWVALYWGGLTVGRLLLGAVGDRLGLRRLIDAGLLAAMAGLAILWLDPGGIGSLGLPLAGLGLAPLFPAFVTLTPALSGADHTDAAVGYQLAAAGLGAASLPWLFGKLAEVWTIEVIPILLVGTSALLAMVWMTTGRRRAPHLSERAASHPI